MKGLHSRGGSGCSSLLHIPFDNEAKMLKYKLAGKTTSSLLGNSYSLTADLLGFQADECNMAINGASGAYFRTKVFIVDGYCRLLSVARPYEGGESGWV